MNKKTKKTVWTKPTIKTINSKDLKKVILAAACSEYDPCSRFFLR